MHRPQHVGDLVPEWHTAAMAGLSGLTCMAWLHSDSVGPLEGGCCCSMCNGAAGRQGKVDKDSGATGPQG